MGIVVFWLSGKLRCVLLVAGRVASERDSAVGASVRVRVRGCFDKCAYRYGDIDDPQTWSTIEKKLK